MEHHLTIEQIQAIEDGYQLPTYAKYPIAVERGQGSYVFDQHGERYLDFYCGHAVALTGHCHPKIVSAICEQAHKLIFYSNLVYNSTRAQAAEAIVKLAPSALSKVYFCNSGAEANETALKIARKFSGKSGIIAFRGGFHGRTCGALSITGIEKYRTFPPFMPGVHFAQFGDLASVKQAVHNAGGDIAAIIIEPIQSMSGVKIAEPNFYRGLRELECVLIFDEVQTGFGRTGRNFFGDHFNICPDIITCAKGIASGVPMGAVLVRDVLANSVRSGDQGSTFGGGPLVCAAAKATAELIREECLADRARELGSYLVDGIVSLKLPALKEIRGMGLLLGLEFSGDAKKLVQALLKRRVIVGGSEFPNTLRVIPPLTICRKECDEFISSLEQAYGEIL